MKKFMKKLIPFLLVLLILGSLVWYGFVYDRDFTRDLLLSQARFFSTNGNQKLSAWFYDVAYMHSGQDEGVAVELANQFKAEGNYTKAEATLSHAIADGATSDLYIALCKVYVEQNKLLDAVAMLENIQDPAIKSQLEQLRPMAPLSDPEPGFFSEYISVGLSASGGTVYYTTDGEYPSTDDIPYSEPFTLAAGETHVQAITVADNGLVSPLSVLDFTVGGVIEEVHFADPTMEAAVRSQLAMDPDDPIFSDKLWTITSFTVPENVQSFSDLTHLPYLKSLTIHKYNISSLQFLHALTGLEALHLTECRISADDLEVIAAIPSLKMLTIKDCGLSTLSGLEGAQSLEVLDLSENSIGNLDPLIGLSKLRSINLSQNALTGLGALAGLVNLEKLDVSHNSLASVAPITGCKRLAWLDVSVNMLTNLDGIDQLPVLTHLSANHNQLTDVTVLGSCTSLVELDLGNNALTDISALGKLSRLELLDFAQNQVTDLPYWADGSQLRTIDGTNNNISSVESLKNLTELSHVYLDYNLVGDLSPLASCYKLVIVNVYGSEVTGVEVLTDMDVIVNYNPTVE